MACRENFRFDVAQMRRIFFITGTDTSVGKTVLTALLARFLQARGVRVAALIVAPNKLGSVNQVLLTLEALPKKLRGQAKVILMSQPGPDRASASNAALLSQWTEKKPLELPWFGRDFSAAGILKKRAVCR